MSDRNSISVAYKKEMVFFVGSEAFLAEDLFMYSLLISALVDGSSSVDDIYKRLHRKCNDGDGDFEEIMDDVLGLSDFNVVVDLDTRNIYFGTISNDCSEYLSWPILDVKEAYQFLHDPYVTHEYSYDICCFPNKRLPFDAFDKESVIQYHKEKFGLATWEGWWTRAL